MMQNKAHESNLVTIIQSLGVCRSILLCERTQLQLWRQLLFYFVVSEKYNITEFTSSYFTKRRVSIIVYHIDIKIICSYFIIRFGN